MKFFTKLTIFSILVFNLCFGEIITFTDENDVPIFKTQPLWAAKVAILKEGDEIIFANKKIKLGQELSSIGNAARVFFIANTKDTIIKISKNITTEREVLSLNREKQSLVILKNAGVDAPEVYEVSPKGHYLIKEFIKGESYEEMFAKLNTMNFEEKNQFFRITAQAFSKLEFEELFPTDLHHGNVIFDGNKAFIVDPGFLTDESLYINPIKMYFEDFNKDGFLYQTHEAIHKNKPAIDEIKLNSILKKYYNNFDNIMDLLYGINIPKEEKTFTKFFQNIFFKNANATFNPFHGEINSNLEQVERVYFRNKLSNIQNVDEFIELVQLIKEAKREKNLNTLLVSIYDKFNSLNPTPEQFKIYQMVLDEGIPKIKKNPNSIKTKDCLHTFAKEFLH